MSSIKTDYSHLVGTNVCAKIKESNTSLNRSPVSGGAMSEGLDFIYGELSSINETSTNIYISRNGHDRIKVIPNFKVIDITEVKLVK